MKISKLSIAVLFLTASTATVYGQTDTVKSEKKIDGVILQGTNNKKSETAILGEMKKAVIQKQSIGAEEISRKGISNVEQGLTKVTGITTVEGKGLFVRGLEERYNYLLINSLGSPSNNPFQKIIALKQFPTDVVGKLNIFKTFNSNLFADFAGATFDIETAAFEKPFTKVEFSVGVNTLSTFRNNFKISANANTVSGYFGLNAKDRELPDLVKDYTPSNYEFTVSESINQFKDSWNVDNVKSLPNTGFGFTTAQRKRIGDNTSLGFLLSLNHSSQYNYREGEKNQFINTGNNIELNNDLIRKQYEYDLESSVLLNLGLKNKGTNLNLNAIFLQNSSNLIEDYRGYKNRQIQNINNGFRTNQQDISRFLDLQLLGAQKIGERHQLKAGASYVINNYQQPDRKILEGNHEDANGNVLPDDQLMITYGGNNLIRQYLDVSGKFYASGFAEYSVFLGDKADRKDYPWQLALGYNGFIDFRENSYRFIYGKRNPNNNSQYIINIDQPQDVFNSHINSGYFHFQEGSDVKKYQSNLYQIVNGGYLNLNFKPTDSWDILLGGRVENNMNLSRYWDLIQDDEKKYNNTRNQTYILPSLSVKKALNQKSNIRFSTSKTITRPILIEYMPIEYINPDNETLVGNSNLQNSENYNVDLKYEIFPTSKEMFSVNLFGKLIDKAIERSFVASGNSNGQTITFFNADQAKLYGIELEGILNLGRISEGLDRWTLGANTTFMYSDVKRSEKQKEAESTEQQTMKRQLQGASPWVVNADLKYEFKNRQNLPHSASLIYNVSGSKIFGVGTNGIDNIYERPFHQLDFIYNSQLTKNWNVKLGVKNILNSEYKLEVGDNSTVPVSASTLIHTNFYRGTNFDLTVGYTF